MEEYRNTVIKLHAIQSQDISKLTSNVSENTSKFTSKTNFTRLGGAMGGNPSLNPFGVPSGPWGTRPMKTAALRGLAPLGVGPKAPEGPMAPFGGNKTATPLRLSPTFPDFLGIYAESLVRRSPLFPR